MLLRPLCIQLLYISMTTVSMAIISQSPSSNDHGNSSQFHQPWMTRYWTRIKDKRLLDLVIPGTHASASYSISHNVTILPWGGGTVLQRLLHWLGEERFLGEWALHQSESLWRQLEAGIRYLELDIALLGDTLYWHSGSMLGDQIMDGMKHVGKFVQQYPREIVCVAFSFTHRGTSGVCDSDCESCSSLEAVIAKSLRPILNATIGPYMISVERYRENSTVQDILGARRGNIITVTGQKCAFPEEYRSKLLINPCVHGRLDSGAVISAAHYPSELTLLSLQGWGPSGLSTHRAHMAYTDSTLLTALTFTWAFLIVGLLVAFTCGYLAAILWLMRSRQIHLAWRSRKCKKIYSKVAVLGGVVSALLFQTLVCLLQCSSPLNKLARPGSLPYAGHVNTGDCGTDLGISDAKLKANSCHGGMNGRIHHMLSRPAHFKVNVILVDDYKSSNVIGQAIAANLGLLQREITLYHQGGPLHSSSSASQLFFTCPSVLVAYVIVSRDEGQVISWSRLPPGGQLTVHEGEYPMDAMMLVSVGTLWGSWLQLYSGYLQQWVERGWDFYVRATEDSRGRGFAYISDNPHLYGAGCRKGPARGYLNATSWRQRQAAAAFTTPGAH